MEKNKSDGGLYFVIVPKNEQKCGSYFVSIPKKPFSANAFRFVVRNVVIVPYAFGSILTYLLPKEFAGKQILSIFALP